MSIQGREDEVLQELWGKFCSKKYNDRWRKLKFIKNSAASIMLFGWGLVLRTYLQDINTYYFKKV